MKREIPPPLASLAPSRGLRLADGSGTGGGGALNFSKDSAKKQSCQSQNSPSRGPNRIRERSHRILRYKSAGTTHDDSGAQNCIQCHAVPRTV
eukprot:4028715-Pyramimonas_sp.AAC.1